MDARELSGDGSALGEGDAEGQETPEACEEAEKESCYLGTCSCKVTFANGKPVPQDRFAMTIREKYD